MNCPDCKTRMRRHKDKKLRPFFACPACRKRVNIENKNKTKMRGKV